MATNYSLHLPCTFLGVTTVMRVAPRHKNQVEEQVAVEHTDPHHQLHYVQMGSVSYEEEDELCEYEPADHLYLEVVCASPFIFRL